MIEISNLSFHYPQMPPLFSNLSLHFSAGDSILLKGENGCGKSTLLKLIMGILKAEQGIIKIAGKPFYKLCAEQFHNLYYQSQITSENTLGISPEQDWQIWQFALPDLPTPAFGNSEGENHNKLFSELSTGEYKQASQRILPYVLNKFWLLDEPFTSLDANACTALHKLLLNKSKMHTGMLLISHELSGKEDFISRVILLDENGIRACQG